MRFFRFAIVLALCAAAPAVHAQPAKKQRIGVLVPAATPDLDAFRDALKKLGHEDANTTLDVHVARDRLDELSAMAAEIVRGSPDVILAVNTPGTQAAMAATKTIPIVMVAVGDPVGMGFVSSLARPDRNVTGVTNQCGELAGKRLALFRHTLREPRRIAIMLNSGDPITKPQIADLERAAPALGIDTRLFPARTKADADSAFAALLGWKADGIMWLCGQQRVLTRHILPLAAKHRLPVMVYQASEVPHGGLMSYAAENTVLFRQAAVYVDKILKGARPGDLPVEQPIKFELIVNLKVAAALGITIPQSVLVEADRLIR